MKIKRHLVGVLQANCYVVWDEDARLAAVIDPGGNASKIKRTLDAKGLRLEAIVHTHDHWDHTAGSDALQRLTGAPVYRHPEDPKTGLLNRSRATDAEKVRDLADGQELKVGAITLQVIHTPGHSRGSICLAAAGVLFSGDLLFQSGVGRTDLKGGSMSELVKSLTQRLAHLPDDTRVLPGHGGATTLGEERAANPWFHI